MVKLAVFDCDGTLIDSQVNILRAMGQSFARAGLPAPADHDIRRVVGLSLVESMQVLLPEAEPALHVRLAQDYKGAFQRLRADRSLDPEPLYDGVADLLDALRDDGWLLGVATGKSDRGLALALAHHGLSGHFVTLQTADRHPSKPHPAMLRAALAEAGATPHQAVIIGDTVYDMAMGAKAGVRAIGVDWGYHEAAELIDAGAIGVAADTGALRGLIDG
ncbi:HAD-IA family hydrolase [Polymorphobacter fuscus]|uniref:HAD-IA family hydrolase n=1 Tax=Sandarakinorhabdus fusca TaxID=1439888 RepID=A0A7C9KJT9_9SPHN|nr:HAD-IA family hydrolase [Polymorphobacter fuscus]KAB7643863.1 HAD-IA family hydrolase [Polymorphobacter fuscus]MQT18560.1 HAD-IA family hydrolase [Polymorphobacter fuscus]NJC07073.1 phosphoglycolate phosphatase [Polymorphobacter fuscus]